ncbi:hypothetical protein KYTH28_08190 [Helicobacter pylori]|nr:hypothetical protein N206_02865 [Helicobacter pylori UM111]
MLLNYDFLEFVDEPQRNTSLTASINKALADKKLARQNKPRVKIKSVIISFRKRTQNAIELRLFRI